MNCKIADCENLPKKRSTICSAHLERKRVFGSFQETQPIKRHQGQCWLGKNGYYFAWKNGKRVYLHRWLMEQKLGRPLNPGEVVHHKNQDRVDNRLRNLMLVNSNGQHLQNHHRKWPRKCRVPNCLNKYHEAGFCSTHYKHDLKIRQMNRRMSSGVTA